MLCWQRELFNPSLLEGCMRWRDARKRACCRPWRCDVPWYQMELPWMEYMQCTGWAWHQSRLLEFKDQMWGKWSKTCRSLSAQPPRGIKGLLLCLYSIKSHIIAFQHLIKVSSTLHEATRGGLWSQRGDDVPTNALLCWLPLISLMDWLTGWNSTGFWMVSFYLYHG